MTVLNRLRVFGFATAGLGHFGLVWVLPHAYLDMILISLGLNLVVVLALAPVLAPRLIVSDMRQIQAFVDQVKRGHFDVSLPVGRQAFGDEGAGDDNEFNRLRVSLNWMARQIALREQRIHAQCSEAIAMQKKLQDMVIRDSLTKIYNRQYFRDQIGKALAHLRRHHRPFALAILDVDFFKRINDTHGHLTGDRVLVRLASLLQGAVREGDAVARIGGEEFAVLLHDIRDVDVEPFLNRLQTTIRAERFTGVEGQVVPVSVSMGFVTASGPADVTSDQLIGQADEALYFVKRHGRDGIMNWMDIMHAKTDAG